jgi:hypothetical protein
MKPAELKKHLMSVHPGKDFFSKKTQFEKTGTLRKLGFVILKKYFS